jgi:UDP-N-acetylmuramate dehydrogenase
MQILENISLKPYNTFRIDVRARYFASFSNLDSLAALSERKATGSGLQLLILGGGSNILFTRDFDGLVLKNEIMGIRLADETQDHYFVECGAGENWHGFVQYCIGKGYAGIENLSLIPGNTGASPMQNIGAYGVEIKDVFHSLEAWDLEDRRVVSFNAADCAFGYRESSFKRQHRNRFVILRVVFRLMKTPVFQLSYGAIREELDKMQVWDLSIGAVSEAVIRIRQSKLPDPAVIGNAGSFFKNPEIPAAQFHALKERYPSLIGYPLTGNRVKLAAGWLIEQAGWKGFRRGDAGCHEKQALVLVNFGCARGKDIYDLSEEILLSVKEKFQVTLEREVNIY